MSSNRRIVNEAKAIEKEQKNGTSKSMFSLTMADGDMYHWKAVVYGPDDSFYEGYEFDVDINIPAQYPNTAPIVKFVTAIQHVNVNSAGDICLDILKDKWTSAMNMSTILASIASLLDSPNPDDAFNADLAATYRTDEKKYEKIIRDSCKKNARFRVKNLL
jgi:ubiquitin-protein ligase